MVIGVSREGGQRRGEIGGGREEIGKTTNWICTGGRAFPHLWQMCSLASGVESLLSMSNGGRNSVHRLYGLAGPRQWAGGQKGDWQGVDWLGWGDRGERRECEEGSDERRRSADWEGSGGRGSLPGGHGGGRRRFCGTWGAGRGLWTKMVASLAAAGLSGGNWPLQVFLAAIVCCRSLWWPVLAAAGLSGCNWPLQVSLAAIVCCRAVVRLLHSSLF